MAVAASPLNRAYLDYNATAPLRPEARKAALMAMETTGNPSSVHAEGRAARRIVEDARSEVARLAGVSSRCVTFVSGGTEAANAALNPLFGGGPNAAPLERLIVSAGEHACVLSGHRFPIAETAPLLPDGRVDLDWLERRLPPSRTRAFSTAGREQRDGRDPAGHRGGGAAPRRGRLRLLRRGADGRAYRLRHRRAGRRRAHAVGPQDGRSQGRRRVDRGARRDQPGRAAHAGRRPGARRTRGHRIRRGDCGFRRRGARVPCRVGRGAGAALSAARSPDNGRPFGRRRCGGLCRDRAAAAQHGLLRRSRRRGRDADDRARSRRRRGEFRLGLLLGQGGAVACAGGDGSTSRAGARRDPFEPRLGVGEKRTSIASLRRSRASWRGCGRRAAALRR